jgi:hypothetical protein
VAHLGARLGAALVHGFWRGRGQNREELTANSPRQSEISGKWWFRSLAMTSLSMRRQTTLVLLSDLSAVVEGKTGLTRHGEAPQLAGWAQDVTK